MRIAMWAIRLLVGLVVLPQGIAWGLIMWAAIVGAVAMPSPWIWAWPALIGVPLWLATRPAAGRFISMLGRSVYVLRIEWSYVFTALSGLFLSMVVLTGIANLSLSWQVLAVPLATLGLSLFATANKVGIGRPLASAGSLWWRIVSMIGLVSLLFGLLVRLIGVPASTLFAGSETDVHNWLAPIEASGGTLVLLLQSHDLFLLAAGVTCWAAGAILPLHVVRRTLVSAPSSSPLLPERLPEQGYVETPDRVPVEGRFTVDD